MKIETEDQLRALYGFPKGRAKDKSLPELEKHCINFIEHSPFLVMATYNAAGKMDVSPRGGKPGFVQVLNTTEIVIPDAKGNNRIDSLVNIVETGQIGSLFFIPGIDETLRINGSAHITVDPQLLARFSTETHPPKTCIVMRVEEAFLHCAKAFMRSKLWNPAVQVKRPGFPTIGQMLKDQLNSQEEPESHAAMVKRYMKDI
ncbi:MAG: pyridoxamine 5'-phosphate oxidase family protein [Flammeovirgaceae bacterium]